MEQNGLSLLRLINQILNLKEIDSNLISLRMIEGNIISFAEMVCGLFSEQAQLKGLDYTFEANVKQFNTQFDRDKIEKVLNNILSNAFKFTNQGSISLKVNVGDNQGGKALVQFILQDSGVGIAQQELGLIFERFYKGDNNKQINAPGSGIGLELVKEFVELHNGHIDLDSVEGLGTTVTISLSMDVISDQPADEADDDQTQDNGRYRILIVEDNIDLCSYIASGLSKQYITFKAYSAEAGLKIISSHHIDLVITDVMLPEMSGYELCSTIKGNVLTSLTPIIILTAKVDNESRIKSYDVGADAFITKPFSTRLLSTRIEKLLQKQVDMQKQYVNSMLTESESPSSESEEDKFLNGLIEVIEKNIDNNEMNIPELCRLFGYSHQQVYLKVKQQTGQSLIEFIKIIRMKRAAQLMRERSDLTVSEVMYEVGIENLSYFSKCFSKYFGVSPKRFKQQLLDQAFEGDSCND
ncbi:MAG: response regulator [Rikenellaceae bacterium]